MAEALMSLGPVKFFSPMPNRDTPNFDVQEIDSNFTWIAQGRLSRDPAMQFTGPGEEIISIEGRLYPQYFGGIGTLKTLRLYGRLGKPMTLVRYTPLDGPNDLMGENFGRFALRRVRRTDRHIGSLGVANRIDFVVELSAFGEDPEGQSRFLFVDDGED